MPLRDRITPPAPLVCANGHGRRWRGYLLGNDDDGLRNDHVVVLCPRCAHREFDVD